MVTFGRLTHPSKNIVQEIRKTKSLGFDYVEIGIEAPAVLDFWQQKKKIKAYLKKFCHPPIGHTTGWYDLSSPYQLIEKAWLEQAREDIELASELGIKLLNFHFWVPSKFLLDNQKTRKIVLWNYINNVNKLSGYTKQRNITIMLENGDERFEYYNFVLAKTPNIKVHLDIGHAFLSGGTRTIKKFISYFGNRIAHIHVHDNHGKFDEHLALRKGKINWKRVVSTLKKSGYEKTITFEVFKSEKDLVQSREYFRKLWNSK